MTLEEELAKAVEAASAENRTFGQSVYENVIGSGEIDTPGERFGATLNDMGKSLGSGVAKGLGNMLTLPQTMGGLMDAGVERMTGVPMQSDMPDVGQMTQEAVEAGTGYAPQTTAGRYTKTVGEFGPGIVMSPMTAVGAGVGSEGAADIANYLFPDSEVAEPVARVIGALTGPSVMNAGGKVIRSAVTPHPAKPANLDAANRLRREGVPLTAGQSVGSKPLQYDEAMSSRLSGVMDDQAEAFTSAAMKRIGVDGLATPENLKAATKSITSVFDDVAARTDLAIDPAMLSRLDDAFATYSESVGTHAALPRNIITKIKLASQGGQPIPGSLYMDIWSRLGKQVKSGDSAMREFAHEARSVLDDALQASATADDAAMLATARQQYRDLLAIEKAVTGAGANAASGVLSPAQLRTAVAGQGRREMAQGGRDLGELSKAGVVGMSPLPQSGTQPRMAAAMAKALGPMAGGGGAGAAIGALLGGPIGAGVGGGLGVAVPAVRNAARMSGLGQKYLANQLMTKAPGASREPIAEIIAALANAKSGDQSRDMAKEKMLEELLKSLTGP